MKKKEMRKKNLLNLGDCIHNVRTLALYPKFYSTSFIKVNSIRDLFDEDDDDDDDGKRKKIKRMNRE